MVERWLDGADQAALGRSEAARTVVLALQRLLATLERDGEEYVAVVNAMQPLLYVAGGVLAEQVQESEKESESRRFTVVEATSGQPAELVLYEDVLVRGNGEVLPLEWLWIAHQREKKTAKLITLDGKVFAFVVQDAAVLDLLRGTGNDFFFLKLPVAGCYCFLTWPTTVSRWLSKIGAVGDQNLRHVRCWCSEFVYRGTARAALFEGRGELATRDGLYTGQFVLGKRNGKGTQVGKGCSYRGHWRDDLYEGRGVLHYARETDAFKFEGHFRRGLREGSGVLYRNDGSSLRCVWTADAPSSPVLLTQPSGAVFVGGWSNNVCAGFGVEDTPAGRYYGEWSGGQRNGRGVLEANGMVYSGTWLGGLLSGRGSVEAAAGGLCLTGTLQGEPGDLSVAAGRLQTAGVAGPTAGPALFWGWLVRARLDAAAGGATAATAAALQSPVWAALLDECAVLTGSLLSLRGPRLAASRRDVALLLEAVAAAAAGPPLDPAELERAAAAELFGRAKFYKQAWDSAEQGRQDLALERGYAWFARLGQPQRTALLMGEQQQHQQQATVNEAGLLAAGLLLRQLAAARAPWAKVAAAEAWLQGLAGAEAAGGLDELLPRAVYSMCLAAVSSLASEAAFVEAFMSRKDREAMAASGSVSYAWTTFSSCVSYCQTLGDRDVPLAPPGALLEVELEDPDVPTNRSFLRVTPPPEGRVPRVESADYMAQM